MVGAGPRQTVLNFTNSALDQAGVNLSMYAGSVGNRFSYEANVIGFTIRTAVNQSNGNIGLRITFPAPAASTGGRLSSQVTVENVEVDGGINDLYWWYHGIYFDYCFQSSILNCNVRGKDNLASGYITSDNMKYAMFLDGSAYGSGREQGSNQVVVQSCAITFADTGVYIQNDTEGVCINDCAFIAINYGVNWISGGQHPSLHLSNTHLAAFNACVQLAGAAQVQIIDNLLYRREAPNTQSWTGIYLGVAPAGVGSFENIIMGNLFFGMNNLGLSGSATAIGIQGSGGDHPSSPNIISNNMAVYVDYFGDLSNTLDKNYFYNNVILYSGGWFTNAGAGAILINNQPLNVGSDGTNVLTANSATPSVGSANGTLFRTANTSGAPSITDFLNGFAGQQLNILCNDNYTTIAHTAHLILRGGVPYAMAPGNNLTLVGEYSTGYGAIVWREYARTA